MEKYIYEMGEVLKPAMLGWYQSGILSTCQRWKSTKTAMSGFILPKTNTAPENRWLEDEISCWDSLFSGDMLVSGKVNHHHSSFPLHPSYWLSKIFQHITVPITTLQELPPNFSWRHTNTSAPKTCRRASFCCTEICRVFGIRRRKGFLPKAS